MQRSESANKIANEVIESAPSAANPISQQQQQQMRCYLCETPKQDYSLIRSFSEIICRGCLNYEGADRVEQLLKSARRAKASGLEPDLCEGVIELRADGEAGQQRDWAEHWTALAHHQAKLADPARAAALNVGVAAKTYRCSEETMQKAEQISNKQSSPSTTITDPITIAANCVPLDPMSTESLSNDSLLSKPSRRRSSNSGESNNEQRASATIQSAHITAAGRPSPQQVVATYPAASPPAAAGSHSAERLISGSQAHLAKQIYPPAYPHPHPHPHPHPASANKQQQQQQQSQLGLQLMVRRLGHCNEPPFAMATARESAPYEPLNQVSRVGPRPLDGASQQQQQLDLQLGLMSPTSARCSAGKQAATPNLYGAAGAPYALMNPYLLAPHLHQQAAAYCIPHGYPHLMPPPGFKQSAGAALDPTSLFPEQSYHPQQLSDHSLRRLLQPGEPRRPHDAAWTGRTSPAGESLGAPTSPRPAGAKLAHRGKKHYRAGGSSPPTASKRLAYQPDLIALKTSKELHSKRQDCAIHEEIILNDSSDSQQDQIANYGARNLQNGAEQAAKRLEEGAKQPAATTSQHPLRSQPSNQISTTVSNAGQPPLEPEQSPNLNPNSNSNSNSGGQTSKAAERPSTGYEPFKCLICNERLEDRHFVQCPSVAIHKFCFTCSKDSIRQQQVEFGIDSQSKRDEDKIFCPSGKKCLLANERSPWTFMNNEIETIFRESSRHANAPQTNAQLPPKQVQPPPNLTLTSRAKRLFIDTGSKGKDIGEKSAKAAKSNQANACQNKSDESINSSTNNNNNNNNNAASSKV